MSKTDDLSKAIESLRQAILGGEQHTILEAKNYLDVDAVLDLHEVSDQQLKSISRLLQDEEVFKGEAGHWAIEAPLACSEILVEHQKKEILHELKNTFLGKIDFLPAFRCVEVIGEMLPGPPALELFRDILAETEDEMKISLVTHGLHWVSVLLPEVEEANQCVEMLIELTQHSSQEVRIEAADALWRVARDHGRIPLARRSALKEYAEKVLASEKEKPQA